MSIRLIQTFLAVAAEGSFTAAANRVGLTQAAVGLQMRALETELNRKLFNRSAKTMELNEYGRELLPLARQMLALHEQMLSQPFLDAPMAGTAHFGGIVSVLRRLVLATLRLKEQHDGLDLHLSTAKSMPLVAQVLAGELDAAIVVRDSAPFHSSLAWTSLFVEPMVVLASAGHKRATARGLLETQPFFRFDRTEHTGKLVDRALKRLRIKPVERLELNAIEGIVDLVRSDLGVAILPLLQGAGWEGDDSLRILALPDTIAPRQIGMVYSRATSRAALIGALQREFMKAGHAGRSPLSAQT